MSETLELFSLCEVRAPAKAQPQDGALLVQMQGQNRIFRVALEFRTPQVLPAHGMLRLDADYSRIPELEYDIAGGDACFPEIHLSSEDDEHFRFKRGNFKDFFSLAGRADVQEVALPLSAFLYNIDRKVNEPESGDFFDKKIRQISFDFLRPAHGEACVVLSNPRIEAAGKPRRSVFACLEMQPHHRPSDEPLFASQAEQMHMRLTKSDFGDEICPPGTALHVTTHQPPAQPQSRIWPLKAGNTYVEMTLPRLGAAKVDMELRAPDGQILAEARTQAVRSVPATPRSASKMGISDGANYQMAAQQGGGFLRLVFGFNSLRHTQERGFSFTPRNTTLQMMRTLNRPWMVSFKAMPTFLRKDVPHGYREGPRDMEMYRAMMAWLIPQLQEAGARWFESWNEANVIHEWTGDWDDMVQMHQSVVDAVAGSGLPGKVLTPSSTTWDFDYFDRVLSSPMAVNSDGLAFHGYTYSPERAGQFFDRLEAQVAASTTPDLPLYLTEVGFRTPALSEAVQAEAFALFTLHAFFRPRVKAITWFRFHNDNPEILSGYNQNASAGYGMVGYRGRYARPALAVYRFLDRVLSEVSADGIETQGDQTLFHGSWRGARFVALAGPGSGPASKFCYDIYGNCMTSGETAAAPLCLLSDADLLA